MEKFYNEQEQAKVMEYFAILLRWISGEKNLVLQNLNNYVVLSNQ